MALAFALDAGHVSNAETQKFTTEPDTGRRSMGYRNSEVDQVDPGLCSTACASNRPALPAFS